MLRFTWPMRRSRSILMVAMCPPFRNELNRSVRHPAELHAFDDVAVQHVGLVDSIRMRMSNKARRAPPPAPRRMTMKQIGQLAGVSQSTVSRVLSGAASIV